MRDIEAAMRSLHALSGVGPWSIYVYGPEFVPTMTYRGQPGRFSAKIAMAGTSPQVELIEAIEGPSIYHEWLANNTMGLHHVGFRVENIDVAAAAMTDAGYPVIQSGSGYGLDGDGAFAYFDTADAFGYVVEAIMPPRRRREPREIWSA